MITRDGFYVAFNKLKEIIKRTGRVLESKIEEDAALELAKQDGNFETVAYISSCDATSYMAFYNLNRAVFANVNDDTTVVSTQTVTDAPTNGGSSDKNDGKDDGKGTVDTAEHTVVTMLSVVILAAMGVAFVARKRREEA